MSISNLTIQNFKSINRVEMQLGDFNVLIGANAAGKTNIVQAVKFLKDCAAEGFENAFSLQGASNYFFNSRNKATHGIFNLTFIPLAAYKRMLGFTIKDTSVFGLLQNITYQLRVLPQTESLPYYVDIITSDAVWDEFPPVKEQDSYSSQIECLKVLEKHKQNKEKMGKFLASHNPNTDRPFFAVQNQQGKTMHHMEEMVNEELGRSLLIHSDIFHLGLLGRPTVDQLLDIGIYNFSISKLVEANSLIGRKDLESDGSNLILVLKNLMDNEEKRHQFLLLLEYALPFIKDVKVESMHGQSLVALLTEKYDENFSLPSVFFSEGTISVIALIIALFFENKSVVVIEEPERYIHPSLLAKLVELMKDASRNKQVIITTHSPELVKHAGIENLLLVQRDKEGFTTVSRPNDNEIVKTFLHNEIGLDDLYIDNLLGVES